MTNKEKSTVAMRVALVCLLVGTILQATMAIRGTIKKPASVKSADVTDALLADITQLLAPHVLVIKSKASDIALAVITVEAVQDNYTVVTEWCEANGPILIDDISWYTRAK